MKLEDFTEEELLAALEAKRSNAIPLAILNPDWRGVIMMAESRLRLVVHEQYLDEDDAHAFFEAVMCTVYGPDYFKWENKHTN